LAKEKKKDLADQPKLEEDDEDEESGYVYGSQFGTDDHQS